MEIKGPRIAKALLKNKAKGLILRDINTYDKALAFKTSWFGYKGRNADQWNRTETPDMNMYMIVWFTTKATLQCQEGRWGLPWWCSG